MLHISVLLVCVGCAAAAVPHYIKPCARSDPKFNACAVQHAKETIKELAKGDRKNNIPSIDPLIVDEIKIDENGFHLTCKNIRALGLKDLVVKDINYDFKNNKFRFQFKFPRTEFQSDYEVSGQLLILPINGKGTINCTLIDQETELSGGLTFETINGKKYLQITKPVRHSVPKRMYLKFTNLFNGNKLLEKQMNEFLDVNWKEVYDELSRPTQEASVDLIIAIINSIHRTATFDELFPETLP